MTRWFWERSNGKAMQLFVTPRGNAVLFHWANNANPPHNERELAGTTEKSCIDWLTMKHWTDCEKIHPPPWIAKKLDIGCEITGRPMVIGEL